MRYTAHHKQETREKLLQSSSELVKKEGFGTVGVDSLMKAIGLSGGAFYSHFSSKDDLFREIVERELSHSLERLSGAEAPSRERLDKCLKQYLSLSHVEQPEVGCALPSLGAEIARAGDEVREQAELWICRLQEAWAKTLGSDSLAWTILCQCVGALVVARMMINPDRQRQVLSSSYASLSRQITDSTGN